MDLVTIQERHKVAASAAPSLLTWIKRITEIDGKPPAITEIYRTPEEQDRLYAGWIRRVPGFNPAYSSKDRRARHIKGLAIDWGFQGRATAHRTAHEFGWEFNVPGEPWHAEKVRDVPIVISASEAIKEIKLGRTIHVKGSAKRGEALVTLGAYHSLTPEEATHAAPLLRDGVVETTNDRLFYLIGAASIAQAPPKE